MDSLLTQVNAVLAQYTKNIDENMLAVMNTASKEGVKRLRKTSPKAKGGGKYARSWAVKREKGTFTIYNKQPGLTHLLENGHDIVRNGRKVGRAPAYPHIKDVDEWVEKTIIERLENTL